MHSDQSFGLIIGAQKCGTTSLFTHLSQHPQVSPCQTKEPNFFSKDKLWDQGWEWYCQLWDLSDPNKKVAIEASPAYTIDTAKSAERIASISAPFRFIYIMRNPLERVESALYHDSYYGWGKKFRGEEDAFEYLLPRAITASKYAKNLSEYYQRFSADQILLLQLEELKHNPAQTLKQICQFLEIDDTHQFSDLNKAFNSRNSYREDTTWRKLSRIKSLKPLTSRVPEFYKKGLRSLLSKPPKNSKDIPPSLTEAQRATIKQELTDDLKKLSQDYGVDITRWGIHL